MRKQFLEHQLFSPSAEASFIERFSSLSCIVKARSLSNEGKIWYQVPAKKKNKKMVKHWHASHKMSSQNYWWNYVDDFYLSSNVGLLPHVKLFLRSVYDRQHNMMMAQYVCDVYHHNNTNVIFYYIANIEATTMVMMVPDTSNKALFYNALHECEYFYNLLALIICHCDIVSKINW